MDKSNTKTSKFLSLILRHKPETVGLVLDKHGWVEIDKLLEAIGKTGEDLSLERLKVIVETNDKQRFAFNEDQTKIRASQGHSLDVSLGYKEMTPPNLLFHGTATRYLPSIKIQGLKKQRRLHVHLTRDKSTASAVGSRHGTPAILAIDAKAMHIDGYCFYLSDNGVWLTDNVPVEYITLENE